MFLHSFATYMKFILNLCYTCLYTKNHQWGRDKTFTFTLNSRCLFYAVKRNRTSHTGRTKSSKTAAQDSTHGEPMLVNQESSWWTTANEALSYKYSPQQNKQILHCSAKEATTAKEMPTCSGSFHRLSYISLFLHTTLHNKVVYVYEKKYSFLYFKVGYYPPLILDYFSFLEEQFYKQIQVLNAIEVTGLQERCSLFSWTPPAPAMTILSLKRRQQTVFSTQNKVPAWPAIIRLSSYYVKSN